MVLTCILKIKYRSSDENLRPVGWGVNINKKKTYTECYFFNQSYASYFRPECYMFNHRIGLGWAKVYAGFVVSSDPACQKQEEKTT